MRPLASSLRLFLPPKRATASSAAVNTPPPPPLPPAPPPPPAQETQDIQGKEMDNGFMLMEKAMRAAPANTPAPTTARGRGRPRGNCGRAGAPHGGESHFHEGIQSQRDMEAVR